MKKVDLSDLKAGDKAFNYQLGLVTVSEICKGQDYCIGAEGGGYTIGGKLWVNDTHPTLFHSEQEFREYWGMESNQLTKREQFAMAAMQGLLAAPVVEPVKIKDLVVDAIDVADFMLNKLNENQ